MTGETAEDAQAAIEEEGFTVTFDPDEPSDPAECTVEDQDPMGEADEGADVTLTISCSVPDVTGEDGSQPWTTWRLPGSPGQWTTAPTT